MQLVIICEISAAFIKITYAPYDLNNLIGQLNKIIILNAICVFQPQKKNFRGRGINNNWILSYFFINALFYDSISSNPEYATGVLKIEVRIFEN